MITENYIKMCGKAKEIQKAWKPELADWFYSKGMDDSVLILGFTKESRREIEKGIWLPTQEHLQEMMTKQGYFRFSLIELFYHFANNMFGVSLKKQKYNSMNELWLAFVMKEKYHKVWNGKDWAEK